MGLARMKSWRTHPVITGVADNDTGNVLCAAAAGQSPTKVSKLRYSVIERDWHFFVVDSAGQIVSKPYVTLKDADTKADNLKMEAEREARFGVRRERACLSCCKPFDSEGIHNRLCSYCRQIDHSPSRW